MPRKQVPSPPPDADGGRSCGNDRVDQLWDVRFAISTPGGAEFAHPGVCVCVANRGQLPDVQQRSP